MNATDHEDRWSIAVQKTKVRRVSIDWAVTLDVGQPTQSNFELRIEQPCVLVDAAGNSTTLSPDGEPVNLAPLLALTRRTLIRADAFKDGHLELQLEGGFMLSIPSSDDYEAWEIASTDGWRFVATPGGDLAVWKGGSGPRSEASLL